MYQEGKGKKEENEGFKGDMNKVMGHLRRGPLLWRKREREEQEDAVVEQTPLCHMGGGGLLSNVLIGEGRDNGLCQRRQKRHLA